jgi:hypothetical protein
VFETAIPSNDANTPDGLFDEEEVLAYYLQAFSALRLSVVPQRAPVSRPQ